jgi:hypothetical protein
MRKFLRKQRQTRRFIGKLIIVNELQRTWLNLAVKTLRPESKWYQTDLTDLTNHIATMSDKACTDAINRFTDVPTDAEMRLHCQF